MGNYSCWETDSRFFKVISLLKIINEDTITNNAPINVLSEGISSQIKYPKIIAKTSPKYLRGVTRETSANLYDWLNHKLATPPKIPIIESKNRSLRLGKTHPKGMVNKLANVIVIEKNNDISQIGSVFESCLIAIATYDNPKQKIIGNI